MEFILIGIILIFVMTYRNSSGEGVYKFVKQQANIIYDQYAPNVILLQFLEQLHQKLYALLATTKLHPKFPFYTVSNIFPNFLFIFFFPSSGYTGKGSKSH